MISNHAVANKLFLALFELEAGLGKARAYADTRLGEEVVAHMLATKSHLLTIGDGITPQDLLGEAHE